MAETLIMVRVRLHPEDAKAAGAYARSVTDALKSVEGFQGFGLWQDVEDELDHLILFSYASPEAAKRGLVAVSERRTLAERQEHGAMPADAMTLAVHHAYGALDGQIAPSSALSLSIRIAEPGYGPELIDEYDQIFAALAAIPGYAGMLIANNGNLPEEVVGLVAWDDQLAFRASLPKQPAYQVKLYERSFED